MINRARIRKLAGTTNQRVELWRSRSLGVTLVPIWAYVLRCRDGQSGGYAQILFSPAIGTSPCYVAKKAGTGRGDRFASGVDDR